MRYRCIDVRIWGDQKFRAISPLLPSGQALFLYLLTNPNTNTIPGLYRAGEAAMAEELGWPIEGFRSAFDELLKQGLVKADLESRVIFIPNAIKYNKPQSPNVVKSWRCHWDEIPECDLKNIAFQMIQIAIKGMHDGYMQSFLEACAKPTLKSLPNQEQDQKKEQEKINMVDIDLAKVREVFTYWQNVMNHPQAKFDQKRKKKIRAAFKLGFSIEQLKQAIDGCAKTPFNMGENKQKQRYDSIGLIFRDTEQIERFISNSHTHTGTTSDRASQIDQVSEGAI